MDLPSVEPRGPRSRRPRRESMIDGAASREQEAHGLSCHAARLEEAADLLGRERTASDGNREGVVELLAPLRDCDPRHLPETPSLEVGVLIHRSPAILLTEKLPDEVFGPAAGKQIHRVHQDALGTQQHEETPPEADSTTRDPKPGRAETLVLSGI